jgi:hypothetical protein
MPYTSENTKTLVFELPHHVKDPVAATEKWLLTLWQSATKSGPTLWRGRAPISLEYVATAEGVRYQVCLRDQVLADATRTLLPSLFSGLDFASQVEQELTLGDAGIVLPFTLREPGWVDLTAEKAGEGVNGVLQALASRRPHETTVVQVLLDPTWLTVENELPEPAFWFAGRIVATAEDHASAQRVASVVESAFGQFAGQNGIAFWDPRNLTRGELTAATNRLWPRRFLPPTSQAKPSQVARLYHPPEDATAHQGLLLSPCPKTPTTTNATGLDLGEGRDSLSRPCPVRLDPRDLLRHGLVVGPTGSGKSTFLAHLCRELVRSEEGVTVIDPHGALVRDIARTLPPSADDRAYLVRFSDEAFPVAVNPLQNRTGQATVAIDDFVEALQRVYGREYWGPLLDLALRHAALATIDLGGTVLDCARLLDDPAYRQGVLGTVTNPETVRFLSQLSAHGVDRRILPAIQRLQRLLATPWLRNIVGKRGNGIDFHQVFDERQILLLDLSGVGKTNASLLGSLLLLLVRQAALNRGREEQSEPRHFVLIDEASWFISPAIGELFEQARKFGVGLVLAAQRVGQLAPEETREAVLANVGNVMSLRVNDPEEARLLGKRLSSERIEDADLLRLPRFEAYAQLTGGAERMEPAWVRLAPPTGARPDGEALESRLAAAARDRYCRPRAVVEGTVSGDASPVGMYEEPEIRRTPPRWHDVLADAA